MIACCRKRLNDLANDVAVFAGYFLANASNGVAGHFFPRFTSAAARSIKRRTISDRDGKSGSCLRNESRFPLTSCATRM